MITQKRRPPNKNSSRYATDIGNDQANHAILEILDALPFYVLLVDENHFILEANKAVYTFLGVKRGDVLGKYCPQTIHGMDHPFPGCPLEEAAAKNRAVERELYDERNGRWVNSAVYPTKTVTRNGKRVFLHLVTDITERKEAQEQLRISHEQLHNLSAHCETVREEEKRNIARDLHDETSQLLASLYAHLEAAIAKLPPDAVKSGDLIKKAQNLSTSVLDEIHKLIYELRPTGLDELGLVPAINSLADTSLETAGIEVSFKTNGPVSRLNPTKEIMLFRVVQEAFNNIIKHSRANKVDIKIQFNKSTLKVKIKDNGIGFNVEEIIGSKNRSRGMGLLNMRERMKLINGKLTIKSIPSHGSEITLEAPLNGEVNG
jgi:PAS domain S-box-containing protein